MKDTILIIDDNRGVLSALEDILSDSGHNILTATDGPTGIETAIKQQPDLIMLDIMMPRLNGYEVAKQLRKKFKEDVKIVFVSIKPKQEVDMKHVDGYIQKPFGITDIIKEVNKVTS